MSPGRADRNSLIPTASAGVPRPTADAQRAPSGDTAAAGTLGAEADDRWVTRWARSARWERSGGDAVTGTRRRVLVVDDEENVAHLVSSALRFDGFETVTADSGSRALAAVAEHKPDLVVLDVMLGDLDGVEVLRRLRSAARTCRSSS